MAFHRGGGPGPPPRRGPPSQSCLLFDPPPPHARHPCPRGLLFRRAWQGAIYAFSSLFSSQPFLLPSFAPTWEHPRAGGLQTRMPPRICRQNGRSVLAEHAKAALPSLGSSMASHCFLRWLVGFSLGRGDCFWFFGVFLVLFFQCSLVEPTLPKGAPPEL